MDNGRTNEPNGLELFNKVINSLEGINERSATLENALEDLTFLVGELTSTVSVIPTDLEDTKQFFLKEQKARDQFLAAIPEKVEILPSKALVTLMDRMENKSKSLQIVMYGSIAVLFLSIISVTGNFALSKQWYSESIRTKTEIRQQILDEIKNDGKSIYKVEDYQQLQHNTELMNKWMKKNPKDAEKFLRFKEGYEANSK